jgi:hypothetical protein
VETLQDFFGTDKVSFSTFSSFSNSTRSLHRFSLAIKENYFQPVGGRRLAAERDAAPASTPSAPARLRAPPREVGERRTEDASAITPPDPTCHGTGQAQLCAR